MNNPNIIYLIQDQMQQQIFSENSKCIMPNMNKLIKDGMFFEEARTCNAICSPSRASLLTGTLPHTHGMVDCTHTVPDYRAKFDDSLDTLTGAMKDEGYDISYYGKWHIERTHKLENFGIDTYETEIDLPSFDVSMKDKVIVSNRGYSDKLLCGIFPEDESNTEEYYIYQKAIADIENKKNKGNPFSIFISTYAPHDPYCVPEDIYNMYEDVEIDLPKSFDDKMMDKPAVYRRMREALDGIDPSEYGKIIRCYYSYCTLVDNQVGKLVKYLKDNDLYDNTMIVVLSDHGDMMGAHGLFMKSVEAFEEVYKIPLIIKMPNQKWADSKHEFYIGTNEIAPTVLELANCRPLNGQYVGTSMVPWITKEKTDKHYAFAEFFGQRFSYTQRIYWKDNMKYVFNAFADDELYDLKEDPFELENLSNINEYYDKKIELCKDMWEIIKNTDDISLADAEYFLLRIAPIGPGVKKNNSDYSIYNKKF